MKHSFLFGLVAALTLVAEAHAGTVNDSSPTSVAILMVTAAPAPAAVMPSATPVYGFTVVHEYSHDPMAFTEGLVYYNGKLFESTGLRMVSTLREVQLETGTVLRKKKVPPQYFAEGLTLWQNRLIQLTYTTEVGFVYDRDTFQQVSSFVYDGEGWGLTHDGSQLIMSDGTSVLRYLDPNTFAVVDTLEVTDQGSPVRNINELEYIQGSIYANIWQTDKIAIISPSTGVVTAWVDLTGLLVEENQVAWSDVLNGIAYDAAGDRLFVTGKFWTTLFEIDLVPTTVKTPELTLPNSQLPTQPPQQSAGGNQP